MRHIFWASALLLLCFTGSVAASSECAAIDNDSERLQCFDAAYRDGGGQSGEAEATKYFEAFAELERYEGELGWSQVYFDDCILYARSGSNAWNTRSPIEWEEGSKIQQLYVDLGDLEQVTHFGGIYTKMVAKRGAEIMASITYLYDLPVGVRILPPSETRRALWERTVTKQTEVWPLYSPASARSVRFEIKRDRSVNYTFGIFWPEDQSKVFKAFKELVDACQS